MTLKNFLKEYVDFFVYCIFGAMATSVNMLSYHLFYNMWSVSNTLSTALSWFFAVTFAFLTNKFFVFKSKEIRLKKVLQELWMFYVSRAGTGVMDVAIMFLAVDIMAWPATMWKLFANFIVGIINYLAGKLLIFKNKR